MSQHPQPLAMSTELSSLHELDGIGIGYSVGDTVPGRFLVYAAAARRFAMGDRDGIMVLRERCDSATIRVAGVANESAILKFWDRSGWRAAVRRVTRTTPAWREWDALQWLYTRRVPVAKPLARFRLTEPLARFSDVLVIEDLGPVQTAHHRMKDALAGGDHGDADDIDEQMILLTAKMVESRVLDSDHSMMNCLCSRSGMILRVDLELARIAWSVRMRPKLFAAMIARLLTSYVYAVQPDLDRAVSFGDRLSRRLAVPGAVLRAAKSMIDTKLAHQKLTAGVESVLTVDW